MPTSACFAVSHASILYICHGTLRPSSGVMVDCISALVSFDIIMFSTWVTVASRVEDSIYFVFICARIRYSWKRSRSATA